MSRHPAPLPKSWPRSVKSAVIQAISLAEFVMAYTRGWGANCPNARIRMKAELDQANQENALLREQLRIHSVRMELTPSQRRPNYPPPERMAILELKAARGWSLEQTAKAFLVTSATISSWLRRLDEEGPDTLVQLRQPVNKFPDFARYIVQRLKTLCPMLGKVKIAQTLARAGLHLGSTTVGRILKEKPHRELFANSPEPGSEGRVVTAKYANHVWHVDLTTVPIGLGFWCSWLPFALPQQWPFCYWVAIHRRSLFQESDGRHRVQEPAKLPRSVRLLGANHCQGKESPATHRLRPRWPVRLSCVPQMV